MRIPDTSTGGKSRTTDNAKSGMKCPVCREALIISERQNIEIDYCPQCRGIWLDRGELDKIIERSVLPEADAPGNDERAYQQDYRDKGSHRDDRHRSKHGNRRGHGSRRKSWLEDIFH